MARSLSWETIRQSCQPLPDIADGLSYSTLEVPEVRRLIRQAIGAANPAFPKGGTPRTVIKSVSAKQRPRR